MASVADCAKAHFIRYYDSVMPLLSQLLTGATDKTNKLLWAKSLECISLVGMAVGRDRFRTEAHNVMRCMQQLQASLDQGATLFRSTTAMPGLHAIHAVPFMEASISRAECCKAFHYLLKSAASLDVVMSTLKEGLFTRNDIHRPRAVASL